MISVNTFQGTVIIHSQVPRRQWKPHVGIIYYIYSSKIIFSKSGTSNINRICGCKGLFILTDFRNNAILLSTRGLGFKPYARNMALIPVMWLVMLETDIPFCNKCSIYAKISIVVTWGSNRSATTRNPRKSLKYLVYAASVAGL